MDEDLRKFYVQVFTSHEILLDESIVQGNIRRHRMKRGRREENARKRGRRKPFNVVSCASSRDFLIPHVSRGFFRSVALPLQNVCLFLPTRLSHRSAIYNRTVLPVFQISGSARNIEPEFLGNLIRGLVYVQVRSEEVPQGELRSQVFLNEDSCSKRFPHRGRIEMPGSCHFGDKMYSDGEKWVSEDDKCTSCTCEVT